MNRSGKNLYNIGPIATASLPLNELSRPNGPKLTDFCLSILTNKNLVILILLHFATLICGGNQWVNQWKITGKAVHGTEVRIPLQ